MKGFECPTVSLTTGWMGSWCAAREVEDPDAREKGEVDEQKGRKDRRAIEQVRPEIWSNSAGNAAQM